uniref:Chemosensory protein 5 n=1 Tax=Ips typographus TaxID=55986 RepID=M3V872_IPSTY
MQCLGLFVVLVLGCSLVAAQSPYTSKYDNVDVDKILKNERVLTNYIKCLMEEGPCTPEGRELRKTLPDALASGCSKCNEKQKDTTEKVIRHLMDKRTKDWDRLSKKYDPQGVYKQRFEKELSARKLA